MVPGIVLWATKPLNQSTAAPAAPEHLSRYTESLPWTAGHCCTFIFLIILSVYYFLTMVRVKFIPFRGSTVTELEMLVKKEQCTSFSWAFCFCQRGQVFRNAKHNLSCKLSLSEGPCSRNSQLTLDFENKNQPLAQCSWILHIWYQKLDTWY